MPSLRLIGLIALTLIVAVPSVGRADDDGGDSSTPPVNPGGGYEDIYPNPTLPPGYVPHSNTSPSGVGSIANTQANAIRLGQSFKATASSLDWVAMVFQYNYQPNTGPMDPALFRIHVASGIVTSGDNSGELIDVMGSTDVKPVTPDQLTGDSLGWILFDFPNTVSLTPGNQYYLRVEHVDGYGLDNTGVGVAVGSLGSNAYSAGARWRAIYNSSLDRWEQFAFRNEDLVFSLGATTPNFSGDYNNDGTVDAADYVVWRKNEGTTSSLPNDPLGGTIGVAQYNQWRANFGQSASASASANVTVPEPASCLMLLSALSGAWMLTSSRARVPKSFA